MLRLTQWLTWKTHPISIYICNPCAAPPIPSAAATPLDLKPWPAWRRQKQRQTMILSARGFAGCLHSKQIWCGNWCGTARACDGARMIDRLRCLSPPGRGKRRGEVGTASTP